jgi:hypothetical protein
VWVQAGSLKMTTINRHITSFSDEG